MLNQSLIVEKYDQWFRVRNDVQMLQIQVDSIDQHNRPDEWNNAYSQLSEVKSREQQAYKEYCDARQPDGNRSRNIEEEN